MLYTVYVLALRECKGLGACLKKFDNKACRLVSTTVVYTHIYGKRNYVDLCLQRSGKFAQPNGLEYRSNVTVS